MTIGPAASSVIDAQGDLIVLRHREASTCSGSWRQLRGQIGSEGPLIVDTQPAAMSARCSKPSAA